MALIARRRLERAYLAGMGNSALLEAFFRLSKAPQKRSCGTPGYTLAGIHVSSGQEITLESRKAANVCSLPYPESCSSCLFSLNWEGGHI